MKLLLFMYYIYIYIYISVYIEAIKKLCEASVINYLYIYKAIIKSFVKLINQDMFHTCPLCGSVEPSIYAKLPMLSFFSLIYRDSRYGP